MDHSTTTEQVNEFVARKLGWKQVQINNVWCWQNGERGLTNIPAYSTSIEAAWEVVEYIAKKLDPNGPLEETRHPDGRDRFMGYGFHLEHHSENSCEKWICTLPEIVCAPPYEEMNDHIQAEADTAPLAICLAFLKLDAVEAK